MSDSFSSAMSMSAGIFNEREGSLNNSSRQRGCLLDGVRPEDTSSKTDVDAMSNDAETAPSATGQRKSRMIWSDEEDATLLAIIEENSRIKIEPTWARIADQLGSGRSGKQCRDRYLNHLRNGIKKGKWTEEEECLLMELHEVFGARWASMAKLFGTRTDNDIKNKWYSMVRKQRRVCQRLDSLAEYNHQNSLLQMQRNAAMFPLTANKDHLTPYVKAEIETADVEM